MNGTREMLARIDAFAQEHGERICGFVTDAGIQWMELDRKWPRSRMTPKTESDTRAVLEYADPGRNPAETETMLAAEAREKKVLWDTPRLTVFDTTPERIRQIMNLHDRLRWIPPTLTANDLIDSDSEILADGKRRFFKLSPEAGISLNRDSKRAWCPVALFRGADFGDCKPNGAGVLATDGTRWAVITAAHNLGVPSEPGIGLQQEAVFAGISERPRPAPADRVRKNSHAGDTEVTKTEMTVMRTIEHVFLDPGPCLGLLDIGIATVNADLAEGICRKYGREPFDLRKAAEWTTEAPVLGVKYMIGMPQDRENTEPEGGCMEAHGPRQGAKLYRRPTGFQYLGLSVNGPNELEIAGIESRNWSGFSGGPVWVYELDDKETAVAETSSALHKTDWRPPKLGAIMFHHKANVHDKNGQRPRGWRDEIYALHVNGAALALIGAMFRHETNDAEMTQPIPAPLTTADCLKADDEWLAAVQDCRRKSTAGLNNGDQTEPHRSTTRKSQSQSATTTGDRETILGGPSADLH